MLNSIFLTSPVKAEEDAVYTVPIEWQKVKLQKQIEDKIQQSISATIPSNKYIVNAEITLSEAKTFGVSSEVDSKGGQNFPLAKLGLNKNSTAYKNAIVSGANSIFTRINTVNISLTVDSSVSLSQENLAKNFINMTVRSFTGKAAGIRVSRAALLPDTTLNNDLKVAQVNVEAAKALAEAIISSNDKIAQAIAATQGVKLPEDTTKDKEPKEKASAVFELPQSWQEWVMALKIPIGFVVATFLLLLGVSGFKRIESQKVALMAQANNQAAQSNQGSSQGSEREVVEDNKEDGKTQDLAVAGVMGGTGVGENTGFNQFKKLSEQYPETASYLVKLWLNMNTKESNEALSVLPKLIPVESLVGVFGGLEDSLKSKLKKASSQMIDSSVVARADSFIVSQMVDTFLINTIVLPDDLKMVLSEMTMEECVECYRRDIQFGAAFINVLPTAQLGKLFTLLSEEEVSSLFQEGLSFSEENIKHLADNLPAMINDIKKDKQKNRVPLLDKALDLISELGVEKENQVFDMLISSGDKEQLLEATQRYFPSQLLLKFPVEKIRLLINRLPTKDRAVLIFSRPKDEQSLFLESIGQSGRLREIINSELNEIQKNDRWKTQILKDQSKIWQNFVTTSREVIRKDESIKEAAESLLVKWLQEKGVDAAGGVDETAAA